MYIPDKGHNFVSACRELQGMLGKGEYRIMQFNDHLITVSQDSNIDDLATIYNLKHQIARLKAGYQD